MSGSTSTCSGPPTVTAIAYAVRDYEGEDGHDHEDECIPMVHGMEILEIDSGNESGWQQQQQQQQHEKTGKIYPLMLVLLLFVAIGALVETQPSPTGSPHNSNSASTDNSYLPTNPYQRFDRIYEKVHYISGTALNDTKSYQYKALYWLATTDRNQDYHQVVERYLLLCLYLVNDWTYLLERRTHPLAFANVCLWGNSRSVKVYCHEDNNKRKRKKNNENRQLHSLSLRYQGNTQQATRLPREIGFFPSLQSLDISTGNMQGSIPTEIGLLSNLKRLHMQEHSVTGVFPTEIGQLSRLESLYLRTVNQRMLFCPSNQTRGIPSEFGQLTRLTHWLDLSVNCLVGKIPAELFNLSLLQRLSLDYNMLTAFSTTTTRATARVESSSSSSALQEIGIHSNCFNGTIPTFIGNNLTNLVRLIVSSNPWHGGLPSELGQLQQLTRLGVAGTCLSGTVASEIAALPKLSELPWLEATHVTIGGALYNESCQLHPKCTKQY